MRKIYFDEKRKQSGALVLFLFEIIVCKDDDFSMLTAIKFINENIEKCTMMYRVIMRNGIDFFQQSNCSHLLLLVKTVCGIDLLSFNKILWCT